MDIRNLWTAAAMGLVLALAPAASAQKAERNVLELGVGSRSFLGVGVAEVAAERVRDLKLKEERGVEVTRVEAGSPAEKAGLKLHDVVLEYNGQPVEGGEQFVRLVRETPAGRTVRLAVSREGQMQTIPVVIGSRRSPLMGGLEMIPAPGSLQIPDMPRAVLNWKSPSLGVEAEALGPQLAEFFGVKEGVLVRSVAKESAAEKAGMKAGDVIVRVSGEKVATPVEVSRAMRSDQNRKDVPLTLVRDKREMTVTVSVENAGQPWRPRGQLVRLWDEL